jgi:hypothetical protein
MLPNNLISDTVIVQATMASKTKTTIQENHTQPLPHPEATSLQATVVSMFTKIIDADTKITYALLKSETEQFYAAWRNSYFARDIMVHRKYNFSGKMMHTKKMTYLADPLFTDVPVVSRYFEFALAPPRNQKQPRSPTAKVALGLLAFAIFAGLSTVVLNSSYVENKIAGRKIVVSVIEE